MSRGDAIVKMVSRNGGATLQDIAAASGVTVTSASRYVQRLMDLGRLQSDGNRPAWYTVPELTGDKRPAQTAMVTPKAPRPAGIPKGVKFTRCPSGMDFRFTADPSIAGRGVISADWLERRLSEAQGTRA